MIGEKIKVSDDSKEENLVMENCEKLEENKELPCIDLESDITIKKEPLPNSSMTSSYKVSLLFPKTAMWRIVYLLSFIYNAYM